MATASIKVSTWIGNVYSTQNKLEHAFDSYNEALKYKSEIDCRDRIIETGLYANIANIYTLRGQYVLALEKHMECLKIKLSFLDAKRFENCRIKSKYWYHLSHE